MLNVGLEVAYAEPRCTFQVDDGQLASHHQAFDCSYRHAESLGGFRLRNQQSTRHASTLSLREELVQDCRVQARLDDGARLLD